MNRLDRNEHLTRARLFSPTTAFGAAFALPILLPGADTALITSAHWAEHTSPVCGCTPRRPEEGPQHDTASSCALFRRPQTSRSSPGISLREAFLLPGPGRSRWAEDIGRPSAKGTADA
ncbi:hypothetical protein OHA79_00025 [Streptomyces sp. NBC_00841]|uniref:hypothetical protein n=1 Tax=Streptomyces sp. NBC_00841 TaxID=2975847 RepID=UPI002DD90216|nr:hypothetical protein [Streptomyces sp. NBC_00841]WRZ96510.1 hypothetical protein OHA79_00025 [Streptomyces sp. NBC_00841]